MIKLKQLLSVLLLFVSFTALAQEEGIPDFIGINPSVTVEPSYEDGEMDINILPFVYQKSISKRLDLRFNTILNLGIRKSSTNISHIGLETALPVFFKKKESRSEISRKIYIAPIVSIARNRLEDQNIFGLWLEPGYHVLLKNNWALSFGPQVGATYLKQDDAAGMWGSHLGAKVIFGKWLK